MLQNIQIENYALIDKLSISLSNDFTVITGETGAGKSILLGALGLVLGKRADVQILQDKQRKCIIEAIFLIEEYNLTSFFETHNLDYEKETTLRREISPSGKTRAFINDTPVNLTQLKELGTYLVDIHSQHETLLLNTVAFKFSVIDSFSGITKEVNNYQILFTELLQQKQQLNELLEQQKKAQLDNDYFQFQLNELLEAEIKLGEQEKLETELKTLTNAEEIKEKLYNVSATIGGERGSVIDALRTVSSELNKIREYNTDIEEVTERVNSVSIEIIDISNEIEILQEDLHYDAERIEYVNERLDVIYSLQQKHQVNSTEELIEVQKRLEGQISVNDSLKDLILSVSLKVEKIEQKSQKLGQKISVSRKNNAPKLENQILELLTELKMPNSRLKIEISTLEPSNKYGIDNVKFLFSANKGGELKELSKVASGGELSRLMLCIKSITSKYKALPTIIFDEIDTGVSGEVADSVGSVMRNMGQKMQVISITHLPQIAGKGREHLYVYKNDSVGYSSSNMKKLNKEERIAELAKMLSGSKMTDAAIENAKELLQ